MSKSSSRARLLSDRTSVSSCMRPVYTLTNVRSNDTETEMCGRFSLACDLPDIAERFSVSLSGEVLAARELLPNTNAAPSQRLPVILNSSPNKLSLGIWGLETPWKKGLIINARRERLPTKRFFTESFEQRRCLIPAEAFYEWPKAASKSRAVGAKPYKFSLKDKSPFAFAGVWQGTPQDARFAIITVEPNDLIVNIHNRMPAIVRPGKEKDWLAGDF